jgi:DnaK suppressor protein
MSNLTKLQLDQLQASMMMELSKLVKHTQTEMDVSLKENYADIESDVGDRADEAFADTTVDIENAMIGLHLQKTKDLNAALDRIQKGTYGVCVDCGSDVGFERLSVYPTAKRCLECQVLHEKMFASANQSSY